jgi:hypothetical protein
MAAIADVGPAIVAGLLLAAGTHLRLRELPCPTAAQVIASTGASRSHAYELRDALLAVLPSLQRPVGRPASEPHPPPANTAYVLRGAAMAFVLAHPGCVYGGLDRQRYHDRFRHFVLELREQHAAVELDDFADAIMVPLGTLKEWLVVGAKSSAASPAPVVPDPSDDAATDARSAQIQTVLSAFRAWHGTFGAFCEHARDELRIPFGRTLIDRILFEHGERLPQRRRGRSPDERALRRSFETFFGGAQWVADGSRIPITINGQRFGFNLELVADAYSDGFVGMSVRDTEDAQAVTEAFRDGVTTTGEAPLALLLDNKPSNHSPEVDAALADATLRIRATLFRPQNKAHAEGGFGLFQQSIPPLDLHAQTPRKLAQRVLELVAQTWFRTINHRPRRDRGGRSRVDLYNDHRTAEQIDNARVALQERLRKQELARQTSKRRQDPAVRALLDAAFTRLGLADPEQHIRLAIARYPIDALVDGIAIFEAKRRVGTLPEGVDARYLLGIVRNLGEEREGVAIADELLRARLDARDRLLAPLVLARDAARYVQPDLRERVLSFADLALAAERGIDRSFWLLAVADEINAHAGGDAVQLAGAVARRILTTHRVSYRERCAAVRVIACKVVPLS